MILEITGTLFILLIAYQIKHFLADFIFQTPYMLGKFNKEDWVLPLAAHVGVHSMFTFAIVMATTLFYAVDISTALIASILLMIIDAVIHFTMDRVKASPFLAGRYTPTQKPFWIWLGVDQMIHHLTHYTLILLILAVCFL